VILIRPDFRSAAIQLTSTQRFARFPRELFVARAEPFELCLFKIFEVEQGLFGPLARRISSSSLSWHGVAIAVPGILNQGM